MVRYCIYSCVQVHASGRGLLSCHGVEAELSLCSASVQPILENMVEMLCNEEDEKKGSIVRLPAPTSHSHKFTIIHAHRDLV